MKLYINMESIKVNEIDAGIKLKQKRIKVKKEKSIYVKPKSKKKTTQLFSSSKYELKTQKMQDCIIRTSFRKEKDLHKKNLEYIQKEGKGINGEKPLLYGSETEEEYKKNMDEKSWRLILSPGRNDTDLTMFTKEFIQHLENETGYKFHYLAANHYNTPHHHVHILINGKDKNGKNVEFSKDMIKILNREIARNILTQMHGNKTQKELREEYYESIKKTYFTKIDRMIEKYLDVNILQKTYLKDANEPLITKRLDFLEKLNLAIWDNNNGQYILKKEWKEQLKMFGKYNTFLSGFAYSGVSRDKYHLHEINKDGAIEGILIKKYIRQDDSNNFAVMLKTKNGHVSYVPLNFYPENIHKGDLIEIKQKDKYVRIYNKNM